MDEKDQEIARLTRALEAKAAQLVDEQVEWAVTKKLRDAGAENARLRGQLAAIRWHLNEIAKQGTYQDEKGRRCKKGEVIVAEHGLALTAAAPEAAVIAAAVGFSENPTDETEMMLHSVVKAMREVGKE